MRMGRQTQAKKDPSASAGGFLFYKPRCCGLGELPFSSD